MADYLLHDEPRCAVNAPTVTAEELSVLRPYMKLARRSASLLSQTAIDPIVKVEIVYCGDLADRSTNALKLEVLSGLLSPHLDMPVNAVNAEMLATDHGLRVLEEHDKKPGDFTSLLKICVETKSGELHRVAGTITRGAGARVHHWPHAAHRQGSLRH